MRAEEGAGDSCWQGAANELTAHGGQWMSRSLFTGSGHEPAWLVRLRMHLCRTDPTFLIVTADARSLGASDGHLIAAVRAAGWHVVALVPNDEHLNAVDSLDVDLDGLWEAYRFRSGQSADGATAHGVACGQGTASSLAAATHMRRSAR